MEIDDVGFDTEVMLIGGIDRTEAGLLAVKTKFGGDLPDFFRGRTLDF